MLSWESFDEEMFCYNEENTLTERKTYIVLSICGSMATATYKIAKETSGREGNEDFSSNF